MRQLSYENNVDFDVDFKKNEWTLFIMQKIKSDYSWPFKSIKIMLIKVLIKMVKKMVLKIKKMKKIF